MRSRRQSSRWAALALAGAMTASGACAPVELEGHEVSLGGGAEQATTEHADESAPSFTLASLGGGHVSVEDFKGEVVLIDFWATWCGPCHYQAEIIKVLHEDFGDQGVQFLAISLGEDEETVRAFVDESPYPYPVLIDPQDQLSVDLGIYVLPTVMVIDREGQVSFLQPGVSQGDVLRRALYEAGVEHPATTS